MYYTLNELCQQLILLSREIPKGDTLTIGWFSSEGQYNFILKGFKISDDSDYTILENAIKNNSDVIGCTCFSEILFDVKNVINDLSIISNSFSLHFFTDGFPVVQNLTKELNDIFEAIKNIKGKLTNSLFVGYGAYYNKELMTRMAEKLGSMLIHNSMISEYKHSITKLIQLSDNQIAKQEVVPVVEDPMAIYTVTNQGVIVYSIDEDGSVYISPESGKENCVYYITNTKPDCDEIFVDNIDFDSNDVFAKGIYAGAFVLTQQMKTDKALEIIGKIGDKNIIDAITNAFTVEEYGKVESLIDKSIQNTESRFVNGRDISYVPPVDAFCVFDVLNRLMKDDEAFFYPYHEKFEYKRIGKKSESSKDYPKFEANDNVKCPISDLVWHKSRLNLSVRTLINGTIKLNPVEGKSPTSVGFRKTYPVFVYRNYTMIKDGNVNVNNIYITTSEDTYIFFKSQGIVIDGSFESIGKDGVYGIDISKLPAINRQIAEGKTSATELCRNVYREQEIKGELKALKWFTKEEFLKPEVSTSTPLTPEQQLFLAANGVDIDKGGLFNPSVISLDATDKYMAKAFEIKIKSLSNLPKVEKVIEKRDNGKSLTLSESVVGVAVDNYITYKETTDKPKLRQAWLESSIEDLKAELNELRAKIQKNKFAVILGKQWYDEFTSRDNAVIEVDGKTFTFVLKEEVVKL